MDENENRQAVLASAEALIHNAVRLLWPLCGEQVTIGILQAMAEEQARCVTIARRETRGGSRDRIAARAALQSETFADAPDPPRLRPGHGSSVLGTPCPEPVQMGLPAPSARSNAIALRP